MTVRLWNNMAEKKSRQLNMEILRIVSMLMIITLHYLDKGDVLKEFELNMGLNRNIAWVIEAICMVSVNIYVLISGYFLSESEFKIKKVIMLWAQILLYSWVITGIFAIVTKGNFNFENGVYDLIPLIMPVTGGHYWFASVYIILYLVFPFLNKGIKAMDKKQHRNAIITAVAIFCVWNTFLPFTQPLTDREGMDICWFACLYLTAAFIRKYGEDFKKSKWIYLVLFLIISVCAFALGKGILVVDSMVGKLGGYAKNCYPYNSLFIFAASVCLFIFTQKCNINLPKVLTNIVLFASQGTFGVYLFHEHRLLRYLWPKWLNVSGYADGALFIPHLIGSILLVFAVGILVDFVRRMIFKLIFDNKNQKQSN